MIVLDQICGPEVEAIALRVIVPGIVAPTGVPITKVSVQPTGKFALVKVTEDIAVFPVFVTTMVFVFDPKQVDPNQERFH